MARKARVTAQISALIEPEHADRLRLIEQNHPVSLSDVIREAIAAGLPSVEAAYAERAVAGEQS